MQLEQAIGFKKTVNMFEEDACMPLPKELMGIELEVEGVRPHLLDVPPLWREVPDDSLRNYGREYIFSEPLYGTGITDALMDMAFFMDRVQPEITYRCSVHVHLNVSDMDMEQLLTLLTLYLIFERTLVKYHGGDREDNIFCIPYYKAPESMQPLTWLYRDAMAGELNFNVVGDMLNDFEKYNALNIRAVMTHGSLEFRHMGGTTDMSKVFEWLKIVQYLKKAALGGDLDYMALVEGASGSTSSLLRRVFKDSADLLMYPDMTNDIMAGARLAQRTINGTKFAPIANDEVSRRMNSATSSKIANVRKMMTGTDEVAEVEPEMQWVSMNNTAWPTGTITPRNVRRSITAATPQLLTPDIQPTPEELDEMEVFLQSLEQAQQPRGTE